MILQKGFTMWIVFGVIAIVSALLNVVFTLLGKNSSVFMFISLSFTALTLCAFLQLYSDWVANDDWIALKDTATAYFSVRIWALTISSIVINSVSFFRKKIFVI